MCWENPEWSRQAALYQKRSDSPVFVWKGTVENVIIFLAYAVDRKSSTSVEMQYCSKLWLSLLGFLIQGRSNGVLLSLHHGIGCNRRICSVLRHEPFTGVDQVQSASSTAQWLGKHYCVHVVLTPETSASSAGGFTVHGACGGTFQSVLMRIAKEQNYIY